MSSKKHLDNAIISSWVEKWERTVPLFSDHIRAKRDGYYHHGLYFSDDEIIQFGIGTVEERKKPREITVIRSDIKQFLQGSDLEVSIYSKEQREFAYEVDVIKENAIKELGQMGYDFLHNNCEHFCLRCIFGVQYSFQEASFKRAILEKLKK